MAATKESTEPEIFSGDQLIERTRNRPVITGLLSSDIGLGGGIPLGCTVIFGGKPKSGKSTTVLQYAANAQKLFGCKIFYANVEGRLDHKTLKQIRGLDLNKLTIIMGPPIKDKEGNVIGNRKMSAQEWWSTIGRLITENPKSIIIVDSISALSEEAELTEGMGHFSRGGLQKLEAQFARQYGDLIVPNNVTLFLLAQIQANTSGYGELIQIKCGNAIRHMADAIIFIKGVERWKPTTEGRVLGHDMVWKIECSPLGSPLIDTKVPLRYSEGLDESLDLLRNSINWEFVKADGARYVLPFVKTDEELKYIGTEFDKETPNIVKAHGEERAREFLEQNKDCLRTLDRALREKVML